MGTWTGYRCDWVRDDENTCSQRAVMRITREDLPQEHTVPVGGYATPPGGSLGLDLCEYHAPRFALRGDGLRFYRAEPIELTEAVKDA